MSFFAPEPNNAVFKAQTNAVKAGGGRLRRAGQKGIADMETQYGVARPSYTQAVDVFNPAIEGRQGATTMYENSLGLHGDEGWNAAQAAYHPLFQAELDAANTNMSREMANAGNWNSGQHAADLYQLGQRMFRSGFEGWQDRLHGLDVLPAMANKAQALTNLGGFDYGFGKDKAGFRGDMAKALAAQQNQLATLLGSQESMRLAADQQGISNALGLVGAGAGMFGKGGAFGAGGFFGA